MATVTRDGFELNYLRFGAGPDLVLLHGLSGDLAFWHPTVISGLASRWRVTLLDLRGHGRSGRPATGYTTRDLAADLGHVLDRLDVSSAHLAGHSFGGAVALHFACMQPGRVDTLVLADARIRALQPRRGVRDWSHWRQVQDWLAGHGIEVGAAVADAELGLLETLARCRLEGKLDGLTAEPFFIPFAGGSPRKARHWVDLITTTTIAADYKKIAGLTRSSIRGMARPTLGIYGSLSYCLPSLHALERLLPDHESAVIEGAGHFHPHVRPREFLATLQDFLIRAEARAYRADAKAARPGA